MVDYDNFSAKQKNEHELIVLQTFPPPSVAMISRENWALVSLSSFRRVERVPLKTERRNVHHQLIMKMTASLVGISSRRIHLLRLFARSISRERDLKTIRTSEVVLSNSERRFLEYCSCCNLSNTRDSVSSRYPNTERVIY